MCYILALHLTQERIRIKFACWLQTHCGVFHLRSRRWDAALEAWRSCSFVARQAQMFWEVLGLAVRNKAEDPRSSACTTLACVIPEYFFQDGKRA